jgi:type I restriction enzyme, S subunit
MPPTTYRLKSLVTCPVQKSDGQPRPFIGLEDIASGTGLLINASLPVKAATDGVLHAPGDVLFSKLRPYLAKSYLPSVPGSATGELLVLRPNSEIDKRFLLYLTLSAPWLEWAEATSYGSKMPRTSWEAMSDFRFAMPAVDEQRRVADFLDAETARMDRMADSSREQSRLLNERFMEIVRLATSGASSPQRATGVEWMPSIRAEWALRKVGREFRTSSGTTPDSQDGRFFDGVYPWVNSSDLLDGDIDKIERYVSQDALDAYSALRIQPAGSLIIAMYGQGETKGRTGLLRINACLNQACCALIRTGRISTEFAQYWFRAHRTGVISLAYGAGQPNLSQELMRQLMVPDPGAAQQGQIVRELKMQESDLGRQLANLTARRSLLSERRLGLITAAVTGQIDVTTARGVSV